MGELPGHTLALVGHGSADITEYLRPTPTEKAANGYQILNLGSTTGALKQPLTDWFDAYAGERPVSK